MTLDTLWSMSPDATRRAGLRRLERAAPRRHFFVLLTLLLGIGGGLVAASNTSLIAQALGPSISGSAGSATGLTSAVRLDPPEPPPPPPTVSPQAQEVFTRTNAERTSRGLAPLTLHPLLTQAAEAHARDQFSRDCLTQLSHTGTDGSSPFDRIKRTGVTYSTAAENIACGYGTPAAVVTGWMNSSGHRANILNANLTHIGISASLDSDGRWYWVQDFATPR
jgi:uncharacterized protein YkwD